MPNLFDRRILLRSGAGLCAFALQGAAQPFQGVAPAVRAPVRAAWINFEFTTTWERMNYLQEIVTHLVDKAITDITLMISSAGGDVDAAISTYNFLQSAGINLTTYNVGNTYSSAVILFLAGARRVTDASAQFLIHPPASSGVSLSLSATDLGERAEALRRDADRLRDIFLARTHITRDQAETMLSKVTFVDSKRALDLGIVTEIGRLVRPASVPLVTMPLSTFHGPTPVAPTPAAAPSAAPNMVKPAPGTPVLTPPMVPNATAPAH